ncbi:hypothetical protein HMPREF1210_00138 [Paenisporosarcina sp. HGH0030]|uniref:hypothetical protein n=1 Tax=Paenisporosarcina sp. HGH0030 TaxID=1078085 RepID=UPI00034E323F|nr:hypothetical protein [Paenisporosarcina sp. HGH0030]EPD54153.1 hypothetical protein HMPREF1210_00138 [Paenisporosarcina sp. HGH0030]
MTKYHYKCSCGQPYNVESEGKSPIKDKFISYCPSCKKQLTIKFSSMDAKWEFDETWKAVEK